MKLMSRLMKLDGLGIVQLLLVNNHQLSKFSISNTTYSSL